MEKKLFNEPKQRLKDGRYCSDEGNIQGYRRGLVALYGEQQVTLLEAKKHNFRKYSDFEYEVLIKHYKEEIKKL